MQSSQVEPQRYHHTVAIIGGAIAGSEAASIVSESGTLAVVFEQQDRPYGKIEDGLPCWHVKQRAKECRRIDANLNKPNVIFVPAARLGTDLTLKGLSEQSSSWRPHRFPQTSLNSSGSPSPSG